MTPPYLAHFGLREPPFSKEIGDADLWLPPSKEELCDELTDAVAQHESVLLTGDPGVGKTCVLRGLRHRIPQAGFRLTYCHNATLGRRDFYRQLCLALGLSPSATAAAVFYAVTTHVQELGRDRVHPAFLLDEAHLLHQDTLDHLHILLNYEWDSRALLSLILVGLPELKDRLELRRNRSLYSRMHRLPRPSLTPAFAACWNASASAWVFDIAFARSVTGWPWALIPQKLRPPTSSLARVPSPAARPSSPRNLARSSRPFAASRREQREEVAGNVHRCYGDR